MRLLDRAPGYDAATFAEAQALVDDGLSSELVLAIFAADAAWLRPLLLTGHGLVQAASRQAPRYAFETSLRRKFLQAAVERTAPNRQPVPVANRASAGMRVAMASSAAAVGAIAAGVLALAVLTSDATAPDIESSLRNADQQVQEVIDRSFSGDVTEEDLQHLEEDIDRLSRAALSNNLDEDQRARAREVVIEAVKTLQQVGEKRPELNPAVAAASEKVKESAQAAGIGPVVVEPLEEPSPTATSEPASPTATPPSDATPTAPPTPAGDATATPASTGEAPTPGTAEPEPTQPVNNASPSPTASVTEAATPSITPAP